jgi:dTDP-glucose 4,6-dehydratase
VFFGGAKDKNCAKLKYQIMDVPMPEKIEHSPLRLLVTGGAGFIGSNFVHYWHNRYPQDYILNFDKLTYAGNIETLKDIPEGEDYHFVQGDITDPEATSAAMSGIDVVVHFAAETHVDRSILGPGIFLQTNVIGTQVLLDAALKQKVKRFHHISTDEVFGSLELGSANKFNEHTPYDPRSPYSASKASSDHLVRAYGETYGLPYSITNCSNNYGEFMFPEKLFPLAITNIIEGKKVPVYGDGLNVRDWLYVQDHCAAIEAVLLKGKEGETYTVGGLKDDVSNLEVVRLILRLMNGTEEMIEYVKDRPGHDRRYAVDWTKINTELGWSPSVTLEEGLQKTIEWYQTHQEWWKPLKEKAQAFFNQNYKKS